MVQQNVAGLDNYNAFSVGVDQLFIVAIELIPMCGDFKACFILKIERIDIADVPIGSCIVFFAFWSFLHDRRRIKTRDCNGACLGVDVQNFFFGEGAFGGQNGARMTWVCAKGHIGLAIFMFVI